MTESMSILSKVPPRGAAWESTHWTVVRTLEDRDDPRWHDSWDVLVAGYRPPMEAYVRRLLARAPRAAGASQDAEDVVQAFLTSCFEKHWLSRADPEQGRFRAWVQKLLRRFTNGWVRYRMRKKRRPPDGSHVVSIMDSDEDASVAVSETEDAEAFDRGWTEVAVDRALKRLRDNNERRYQVIHDLVTTGGVGSSDMAARLKLTPKPFSTLKHNARKEFRKLFQQELRGTVGNPEDFEAEWRALQPYMP